MRKLGRRLGRHFGDHEAEFEPIRPFGPDSDDGVTLNFNMDSFPEEEKEQFYELALERSELSRATGPVEHGYSKRRFRSVEDCPRCGAGTQRQYGHFVYATQLAMRAIFAPAGHFCTACPSVIVDEDMIEQGIQDPRCTYLGVLGLDYGEERQPDYFRTWNGEEAIYLLDENENPIGIATQSELQEQQRSQRKQIRLQQANRKAQRKRAKQSRRRNRRK